MTTDTITESELAKLGDDYWKLDAPPHATPEEYVHLAIEWAVEKLGITIVPDPIPEPEGDVIVVDREGLRWIQEAGSKKWLAPGGGVLSWNSFVSARGPVKVYRLEEAK